MNADHTFGVEARNLRGNDRSPVITHRSVPIIAKSMHQFDPGPSNAIWIPARFLRRAGKTKAWQCRDDKMEGIARIAPMRLWIGEWLDDF